MPTSEMSISNITRQCAQQAADLCVSSIKREMLGWEVQLLWIWNLRGCLVGEMQHKWQFELEMHIETYRFKWKNGSHK